MPDYVVFFPFFFNVLCNNTVLLQSKPFWVMAKAVRDFVENEGEGLLPLRGSVPDMTAKTDRYVALQQV